MKKEYVLVFIAGLFLLAYVLDAVVDPLNIDLATPYHYLSPNILTTYPFTTASIVIKSMGMFLLPLLLLSFAEGHHSAKAAVLLVLIALMELYALQEVATSAQLIPLEWSISLAIAGIVLFIPMISYFIRGGLSSAHQKLSSGNPNVKAPNLSSQGSKTTPQPSQPQAMDDGE